MSTTIPPPIPILSTSPTTEEPKEENVTVVVPTPANTSTAPSSPSSILPTQLPSSPSQPPSEPDKSVSLSRETSFTERSESPSVSKKNYSTKFCAGFKNQAKTLIKSSKRMSATLKDFNEALKAFTGSLSGFVPLLDKDPEDSLSINALINHLKALSTGYDTLFSEVVDNFDKSLETFHDYFFNDLFELEKRKEKLRIESNYQNRKNMDKIRADYNNANKQFQNKYTEITTLLDPTFMATILTLSKAFFDMKAQYDTASQLEERVGALEKRVESSAAAAKKVAKEGYLSMKTTFSWQREYFMIKDGRFLHLTPGKVATPYVVTAVRLYNQKAAAMKFIDADRCLEVVCDKRKSSYVLQAQSKQERDAWFSEVSSIVVAPAPPPQPPAAAATTTTTTTTSATATTTASSASTTATAAAPVAITVSAGSTASSSGTPIISPTPQQGAQKQLSLDGESQTMSPSLFRRRGRFASVSGPNTGGSKRRSKSPENPRSASPGDYAPHLTWEELKAGDLLQKPVSYTKRASNRGSDARNIKLAGIPPWALTSVAKGSESAERLPLFPPLTLDSFYKEFTYVESNSAALHHADRSEDIFASSNTDTASNCDTASSSSSSSSSYTTTTTAAAGGSGMTVILNAPSPNFSHSHTLSQGQALGIAAATASAGAGELHEHQSRLRSYSTVVVSSPSTSSSFSPSSPSSSAGLNDDSCRASVNITVAASAAAQPQVQCSPIMSFQGRKRTTTLRRKKTVVEEMPEIPDDFAIDTDKVTEGLTFAELVKRLSETDKGVTLIEGEAVKTDDLEKLNGAVETLHLIKGHLTFMSGESFEPAATVDEAKKRISESVPELRDNIKEIASSLKLVVPDNSSTWAFYVQPIEDAYNSFMKYKSKP